MTDTAREMRPTQPLSPIQLGAVVDSKTKPQKSSPGQKDRTQKWIICSLLVGLSLFVAGSILRHPLATNDGPVHLAFAHLISTYGQPGQALQSKAYTVSLRLSPNLGVYVVMAYLMKILSPALTESIIQILCVLGPLAAGYFAIRMIDSRNAWLSVFLFPLALNQMFFLGLYNHSISIAAFLLTIGTYLWLCRAPSYPRAIALAGSLFLTFLCHASGFLMAFTGLTAMIATLTILSYIRERSLLPALKAQRFAILAMVLPIPLGAFFFSSGEKSMTKYGLTLPYRIKYFAELHLLAANFPSRDRYAAAVLSALLFFSFAIVSARVLAKRQNMSQMRRDQALGVIVATLASIAVMLAFPDIMGGGWTHFRRFEIFPFYWMILVIAFEDFAPAAVVAFTAIGASTAVFLIASTSIRQRMVREQMAPLAEVDSLVGAHCTVLPVVFQASLQDPSGNPDFMDYEPFFQSASRLELHHDRVVLFNYLARLAPYPVHFRPGVEPQANIFRWEPDHMPNDVEKIDIPGFEAGSGMRVDYILLWGNVYRRPLDMRTQVSNATRQFVSIYKSANDNVELYRRKGPHNAACVIDQETRTVR